MPSDATAEAELEEENDRLRTEVEELKKTRAAALRSAKWGGCVEITGEGGSPVYARGLIHTAVKGGGMYGDNAQCFTMSLIDNENPLERCPVEDGKVLDSEVRGMAKNEDMQFVTTDGNPNHICYIFHRARDSPWDGGFTVTAKLPSLVDDDRDEKHVSFTKFTLRLSDTRGTLFHGTANRN